MFDNLSWVSDVALLRRRIGVIAIWHGTEGWYLQATYLPLHYTIGFENIGGTKAISRSTSAARITCAMYASFAQFRRDLICSLNALPHLRQGPKQIALTNCHFAHPQSEDGSGFLIVNRAEALKTPLESHTRKVPKQLQDQQQHCHSQLSVFRPCRRHPIRS